MKTVLLKLTTCLVFVVLSLNETHASSGEYLFDVLRKQNYAKSWDALISSEKSVDLWLSNYLETNDGPAFPGELVSLSDGEYQVNGVCKAHDCGDNQFFVLFSPKGNKAWGLLVTNISNKRYFGKPNVEQKTALRVASQK